MYWPIGTPRVYAASKQELSSSNKNSTNSLDEDAADPIQFNVENKPPIDAQPNEVAADQATDDEADELEERRLIASPSRASKNRNSKSAVLENNEKTGFDPEDDPGGEIVGLRVSRNGHIFATITRSTLTIWQTKPTAAVASALRSAHSLKTYGHNSDVLLRPDSAIVVVQTAFGYLITYSLATDASAKIYLPVLPDSALGHSRRRSTTNKVHLRFDPFSGPGEGHGIREVSIRFRMVIKVDAGITKAIALDDELIVATERPPAIQCVRWVPDESGSQATTELFKAMPWISKKSTLREMVHDRPMNISTWITSDGKAFAVQKSPQPADTDSASSEKLFKGYCFHDPDSEAKHAVKAAISARFSLIAVGCANGDVDVYTARDYAGHVPLSHRLSPPTSSSHAGTIACMSYSPDGYALFVGYEKGWALWSVYGKLGASSFSSERSIAEAADEGWLTGVKDGFWVGGGSQLLLLGPADNRLWVLDVARSAVAGCFSSANVARSLLQTHAGFMIYRGYDLPDIGSLSLENGLWHNVQIPAAYLHTQWPIRSAVISTDGRYVAVAGRRGLAHYSVTSGRWKTFDDPSMEDLFTVRGGMCWYQHVLIAAVESNDGFQIRIYSRESALDSNIMHIEQLSAPVVMLAPSGQDSLLVYTYENLLYHYIISVTNASVKLVQVGQIALHGIIRSPPRVRAMSWILPEDQLESGDPSQDVTIATVLFLVDGKLVVLQPTTKESGELKYDMRIIAQNVEYYVLMRDQQYFNNINRKAPQILPPTKDEDMGISRYHQNDLRDSLWYFDGFDVRVWVDAHELLASASPELGRELPVPVKVPVDFYPLSVLLNKGILFGVEPDMMQRRDIPFSILRFATRTQLFLPQILRYHLAQYNSPSALFLSHHYQHLEYFPHALEVLLHDILDEEVDASPVPDQALLPSVLSFLSSFPQFLEIIVQCTRKTEARSWHTLFAHLPPPRELFEESLQKGNLKTAGGYLLVLHTLDELETGEEQVLRLLQRAKQEKDWELCKELARFLMALDTSGDTLRRALRLVGLQAPSDSYNNSSAMGMSASVSSRNGLNGAGLGISPETPDST